MDERQEEFIRIVNGKSVQEPTEISTGEILIWLYFCDIDQLTKVMGGDYFAEEGKHVSLQEEYICLDIRDMMKYLEIKEEWVDINYYGGKSDVEET